MVRFAALMKRALKTAAGREQVSCDVTCDAATAYANRGKVGRAALSPEMPQEVVELQYRSLGLLGDVRVGVPNDTSKRNVGANP
jgi:hypothetical protein